MEEALEKVMDKVKLPFRLKTEQKEILFAAVEKQHTLGILPTGFGKSECFGLHGPLLDEVIIKIFFFHIIITRTIYSILYHLL